MKHINFRISTLAIIVLAFTSCSTIRVNYYGNKVVPVQKIALVSTMIGKIQQSPIPLLDAAVFNAKTNKIADQIMDMQKKAVDKYQVLVASGLKNNFNCQVIYADSLHNLPGFVVIKEKYNFKNGLRLKSDNYPFIFTAKDDINPFNFDNGNIDSYFRDSLNYKSTISEISKKLNTDLIAVSYSTLATGAGSFGIYGQLQLVTILYIFDKNGDLLSKSSNMSKPTNISGSDIEEYRSQLDNLSLLLDPMLIKVVTNFQNPPVK
jgi:hypothetical protein